jgi:signal transduction histidine kinase
VRRGGSRGAGESILVASSGAEGLDTARGPAVDYVHSATTPVAQSLQGGAAGPSHPGAGRSMASRKSMALILYVTADAVSLRQVSALLGARGMDVAHGGDGRGDVPLQPRPDLIVVDTELAEGDAATLLVSLGGAAASLPPVLVLADRARAEAAVAALGAGASDVVFRPVDPMGLPLRIEGLLARRSLELAEERLKTMEFRTQELESFIYIVTHDMKTPVVNLQGLVGLIEQDHAASLPDGVKDYLVRLRRNAHRLEELLHDLLEYPNRLRLVGPVELKDVGLVAALAVDGLQELARSAGVDVVVAPDMPHARCDEKRLQQVFHNLVENAIKHARSAPHPRVDVGWTRTSGGVRFEVRDNGPGIPKEQLQDIFKLFHRIPGTPGEGTGIGLAVARQLVEAHGGEIWCESREGGGSTFAFTIGS